MLGEEIPDFYTILNLIIFWLIIMVTISKKLRGQWWSIWESCNSTSRVLIIIWLTIIAMAPFFMKYYNIISCIIITRLRLDYQRILAISPNLYQISFIIHSLANNYNNPLFNIPHFPLIICTINFFNMKLFNIKMIHY